MKIIYGHWCFFFFLNTFEQIKSFMNYEWFYSVSSSHVWSFLKLLQSCSCSVTGPIIDNSNELTFMLMKKLKSIDY